MRLRLIPPAFVSAAVALLPGTSPAALQGSVATVAVPAVAGPQVGAAVSADGSAGPGPGDAREIAQASLETALVSDGGPVQPEAETAPGSQAVAMEAHRSSRVVRDGVWIEKMEYILHATLEEALEARRGLTATGPDSGLAIGTISDTPPAAQNNGATLFARKVRLPGLPGYLGSDARGDWSGEGGFSTNIQGRVVNGSSRIDIFEIRVPESQARTVAVREQGLYRAGFQAKTAFEIPMQLFASIGRTLPFFGSAVQAVLDRFVGNQHTSLYSAGAALANVINRNRRKSAP